MVKPGLVMLRAKSMLTMHMIIPSRSTCVANWHATHCPAYYRMYTWLMTGQTVSSNNDEAVYHRQAEKYRHRTNDKADTCRDDSAAINSRH